MISNGRVIGEKYADGYNSSSHGTSWSMAKSYYAALIGVSIDRGEIASLDDKVKKYLEDKEVRKIIYVPGKILNIVL